MKVSELTGEMLDYWVANADGKIASIFHGCCFLSACRRDEWTNDQGRYEPSTDWAQGGPLIEREKIRLNHRAIDGDAWAAQMFPSPVLPIYGYGPTPLIAAMRCYVASKYGAEVPTEATE